MATRQCRNLASTGGLTVAIAALTAIMPLGSALHPLVTVLPVPEIAVSSLLEAGQARAATVKPKARSKAKPKATRTVCKLAKVKGKTRRTCRTARVVSKPAMPRVAPPPVPPVPIVPAPPPPTSLLPLAAPADGPARVPITAYYFIDQADSLADALGKSPPDFGFDCGGFDCYAWISRGGEALIVEPGRDGVVQYYYAPGETSPYLVRDSYNAFAFDGRQLAVVYDRHGAVDVAAPDRDRSDYADRLRERGRALYAASLRQRRWDSGSAVAYGDWYDTFSYYPTWGFEWDGQWRRRGDYDRIGHRRDPRRLEDERQHRRHAEGDYQQWRRRGGTGAPPPTGNPLVTPVASPITPVGPGGSNGAEPGGGGPHPRGPGWRPAPQPSDGNPPAPPAATVPAPSVNTPPQQGDRGSRDRRDAAERERRERARQDLQNDMPVEDAQPRPRPQWRPAPPAPALPEMRQAPPSDPPPPPPAPAPAPSFSAPAYAAPPPPPPPAYQAPEPAPVYVAPPPAPPPPPPPPPPQRERIDTSSGTETP